MTRFALSALLATALAAPQIAQAAPDYEKMLEPGGVDLARQIDRECSTGAVKHPRRACSVAREIVLSLPAPSAPKAEAGTTDERAWAYIKSGARKLQKRLRRNDPLALRAKALVDAEWLEAKAVAEGDPIDDLNLLKKRAEGYNCRAMAAKDFYEAPYTDADFISLLSAFDDAQRLDENAFATMRFECLHGAPDDQRFGMRVLQWQMLHYGIRHYDELAKLHPHFTVRFRR